MAGCAHGDGLRRVGEVEQQAHVAALVGEDASGQIGQAGDGELAGQMLQQGAGLRRGGVKAEGEDTALVYLVFRQRGWLFQT